MRRIGRASSRFGIGTGARGTSRSRAWDERFVSRDNRRDWFVYAAVAAVAIVVGVVNALSMADDIARRGGVYDLRTPLLWDMTSIAVIILLTPALSRRRAADPPRAGAGGPDRAAIATIVVFSAVHITGMVGLRKLDHVAAGGAYDFRFSLATVLYEFRKDVVTCVLIGGGMWLIDGRREAQRALQVETPPRFRRAGSAAQAIWLRDGTTRIRIEPQRHPLDQFGRAITSNTASPAVPAI